jgi:hypothetical protein
VAAEIVHDDDVAGPECRNHHLFHISEEAQAVDRSVEDTGRIDPVAAQRRQEGQGSPPAMGRPADKTAAAGAASVGPRHVGLGPGLVDEHEPGRIKFPLMPLPSRPAARDVRPFLLAGQQAFF